MSMGQEMVVVPGRILPAPKITYLPNSNNQPRIVSASWNLNGLKFHRGAALKSWSCLVIQEGNRPVPVDLIDNLISAVEGSAKNYGMQVTPCMRKLQDGQSIPIVSLPRNRDTKALIEALSPAFARFVASNVQIIYVMLPTKEKVLYSAVKYCGDIKFGVGTVCSQISTASKPVGQAQYMANVMLKFNIKLGGINHTIDRSVLGVFGDGKTMLVGCDVTHPSPGSFKGVPSVAGVVASVDPQFVQFPGSLRLQTSKKEMIEGLDQMFAYHLKMWYDRNGKKYPERIIVYRDGVSEGKFFFITFITSNNGRFANSESQVNSRLFSARSSL